MTRVFAGLISICLISLPHPASALQELANFQTVAESSDFKSTCSSSQVVDLIDQCAKSAQHVSAFTFGETVEGRPMRAVAFSNTPYSPGDRDNRVIALVIGNIHSGECAGKEAILMMVRDLALNPNHPWLKNLVLVFVPNYNADANDRMGKNNRPGQLGPENGMGRRENAQNLDLNRDFVKLESPEARNLVKLIDTIDPHMFIDCHTTNGSKHRYALTYDIPHNPATASQIRDYMRNKMMPVITRNLEEKGTQTFFYGNFDRAKTTWTTYGHEPRYSTEYVGLRGRLAILSEAYSYISFQERILASKAFVSACLDFANDNAAMIRDLIEQLDKDLVRIAQQQPSRISMPLNARVEKFGQQVKIKGYKDDQPFDYPCDFVSNYVPTRSVPLAYAYLVPKRLVRIVDRLRMHGIQVEETIEKSACIVTVDTVKELNRNERVFQKHRMMQAQIQRESTKREIPKGTFVIRTSQPLGRLASYLLESESDDGFVFWNFLDHELNVEKEYPIMRIDQVFDLKTKAVDSVPRLGKLSLDQIGGMNSLIPTRAAPRWSGKNQIEVEMRGRKILLDADSLSFVKSLDPVFTRAQLKEMVKSVGLSDSEIEELVDTNPIESNNRNWLVFDTSTIDLVVNAQEKSVHRIENAELYTFSPDQQKLGFVDPSGLNVLNLDTMETVAVNPENPETQLLGKLDWVYQEELYGRGNFKGYWFSPDSQVIAFLKLDESAVQKFTISDHIPVRGKDELLSYPKAGDPNPVVSVGMAETTSAGEVAWVDLQAYQSDQPLVSNVSWRPDSSQLILQIQNRDQTYLDVAAVNKMSRQPRVLFRDQTPAWIESPGEPHWLTDGSFLWLSPRNGYKHLYHYNPDGSLKSQLTSGAWEIRRINAFDQNNSLVYFSAAKESPRDLDAYRLDVSNGNIKRLTVGPGTHSVAFNDDNTMFIDTHSQAIHPNRYRLYTSDGEFRREINASSDDRLMYAGLIEPEFIELETNNNQPLDAMIIRPPNFDPARKYPVLIHSYAGPQAPQVRNRFAGNWGLWHQALAQQGYVIWKCDNQSASYRSAKNAWPIHRDLGSNELADIERGVAWLKQQPWVDSDRIGIWGWSYGGYITAYALTHSQSFCMGISGAPVTDWRNYDTIYTERLMGLPQDNAEGYDASSVVKAAANLSGKLLLIHGSIDDNVHLSNSMQFAHELQKAGKQFEMMIYPRNRHSIRSPEQAKHLRKLMFDFVVENL